MGIYGAIVTALYRRERTGGGSYVTTSLLAQGVWSASVFIQAALSDAKFFGLHDRMNPANAALNVYRASDDTWFVLIVTPDKLAAVAKAIGREDLLADPRFSDPAKLAANMPQLTAILDETFGSQPMAHWHRNASRACTSRSGLYGSAGSHRRSAAAVERHRRSLEGAGDNLKMTVSSPIQVHGVTKVAARRANEIGEHNEEVLTNSGSAQRRLTASRGRCHTGAERRGSEETPSCVINARRSHDDA
jgi:formyl-CoA transferase